MVDAARARPWSRCPTTPSWLSDALADLGWAADRVRAGGRVIGGSGGVGASTWRPAWPSPRPVQGRAQHAGRRRSATGGGIDLLLGAERVDGWRWPRLAGARGHLGDLAGQLPTVDGVDVLAMARTGHPRAGSWPPSRCGRCSRSARAQLRGHRRRSSRAAVGPRRRGGLRLRRPGRAGGPRRPPRGGGGPRVAGRDRGVAVRAWVWCCARAGRGCSTPTAVAEGLGLPLLGTLADEPGSGGGRRARRPSRPVGAQPAGAALPGAAAGLIAAAHGRAGRVRA